MKIRAWGRVREATVPELAPFVRQKTVLLTTYKKDGSSGSTPLSIAVDGGHAYLRSYRTSLKTRRMRRDPRARVAPSTGRGRPQAGPELAVRARLLERGGEEDRRAARLLRAKYPLLHGVVVPLSHRLMRQKVGHTVHFEVRPDDSDGDGNGGDGDGDG